MAKLMPIMLCCMAVLLSAIGKTSAVDYTFTNTAQATPGGARYDTDMGGDYSLQLLQTASAFIWSIFQQQPPDRKDVQRVELFVDDVDGLAYTIGNQIHVSASHEVPIPKIITVVEKPSRYIVPLVPMVALTRLDPVARYEARLQPHKVRHAFNEAPGVCPFPFHCQTWAASWYRTPPT